MNLIKALMIALILSLISCASKPTSSQNSLSENVIQANNPTVKAPDIAFEPEKAFFPLRLDPSDNKFKPSYQNEVCIKKFVICLKWEKRTLFFEDLTWFYQLGFGLYKMRDLK